MFENIKTLGSKVYGILTDKNLLLWQKIDMLIMDKTQTRIMIGLFVSVPVLWLLHMPILALLPTSFLVFLHLYYGMFAGGCEGALLDIPFIIGIGLAPFGWKIAVIAFVISWPILFAGLTAYQSLRSPRHRY